MKITFKEWHYSLESALKTLKHSDADILTMSEFLSLFTRNGNARALV